MSKRQPKVFVISGPSRAGKDAITSGLLRKRSLNLAKVVTATSRPRRNDEVEGKHYYFLTPEEFKNKIDEGYFLEWAILRGGKYFGTPIEEFDRICARNKNVIMNIDVQGAKRLSRLRDDLVKIFIKPDSFDHVEKRMHEAGFGASEIKARLADAKRELGEAKNYDYTVVNYEGRLDETIAAVAEIIKKETNL
ncbi:MAG: guanylate kinase [Candidatus Jacksonbacteria bacterium RIFOXYC2_FULL_44_29]|nr:MAG: Guanylate kinase [Parcubacteria group bacterium GW2011_GWC2_44_22]OGY76006.1 MAG: guanylate kinase [Candidatus Jacksonbacteria bacterium RIFOXYA2_FULL_43_12]OGY76772.1 MAG: guanylate kinase [Candidatus Jacksonbacteria bacterium RIFOXYB2_FULL_44_15]OGY79179.1 MAG: guanylate kinase [Candidatus Jacksonbacteria bacterium RIFOXYC2_FULL_44_29]OGY82102.1 MAG: guanylate kinase [Candidatus Jacksonbacteria bacterium RIFOXYD2_FULL_43_21]HBH46880.1 guanylate kinase [Candidatus Jacksonbacteria bact